MKTCLVVDDSKVIRKVARHILEALNFSVTEAGDGREALDLCRQSQPDVILLDINMPGMNGFEVLAALKAHPRLAQIPVVMLTTSSHESDVTRAYTLHASSYLVKSVNFRDFVTQIESFLEFWRTARLTTWPEMIAR